MDTGKVRETAERFYHHSASEPNSLVFLHDFHDFLAQLKTDSSWSDHDIEAVRDLVFRMVCDRKTTSRSTDETISEDAVWQRRPIRIETDEPG